MKKVRLFVCGDMTVIDIDTDVFNNFRSYNYDVVVANVVEIKKKVLNLFDGSVMVSYVIATDYYNPYRSVCSKFSLNEENFAKVCWVE
jgi:hypothetical protein